MDSAKYLDFSIVSCTCFCGLNFSCFHACHDIAKWRAWSKANHTTLKHKNKFELEVNEGQCFRLFIKGLISYHYYFLFSMKF